MLISFQNHMFLQDQNQPILVSPHMILGDFVASDLCERFYVSVKIQYRTAIDVKISAIKNCN